MKRTWMTGFVRATGAMLLALALVRFLSIAETRQLLAAPDPVVGLPVRWVALTVGVLELGVALVCLSGRNIRLQAGLIVWLATNFAVYRAGLIWQGYHVRCSGWGSLTNPLHLSLPTTDYVVCGVMAMLLAVGGVLLAVTWKEPAPQKVEVGVQQSFKMACGECGGRIEFDARRLGQETACPHCAVTIVLRKPGTAKTSCHACGGHIEFPMHALGEKIPCPHCAETVALAAGN